MLQALRLALASRQSEDCLVQILADEIEAVRCDRRFDDYRVGHILADTIDRIREGITRDLSPRSPCRAAHLLGQLIRLDTHAFEHSDDSNDVIGEVIRQAVADFGQAWTAVPKRNIDELSSEVLAIFCNDAYGVREGIIVAFRHALGTTGLDRLEILIRTQSAAVGSKDGERIVRTLQQIAAARELLSASETAPGGAPAASSKSRERRPSVDPGGGAKEA